MSRDDAFGNRPAWVAFFTLPAIVTLLSVARNLFGYRGMEGLLGFAALPAVPDPLYAELLGLVGAAAVAFVVGPHLTLVGALALSVLFWVGFPMLGVSWDHWGALFTTTTLETASLVAAIGAMGASTGGGAPGLRYATASFAWAGWVLAPVLALLIHTYLGGFGTFIAPGLLAFALMLSVLPATFWWVSSRHPRPAAADATFRVAGVTGVAFALVGAVWAVDTMRINALALDIDNFTLLGPPGYMAHAAAAIGTACLLGVVALVLQVMGKPARMGILTGGGCLLVALAGLGVLNADVPWLIPIGLLAGIGHATLLPWTWARSTSDVHWRFATGFGGVVLFAPHTVDSMTPLWAAIAMSALALAAVAVGALGWFGDDWIYGDIPGSSLDRRGR